MDKTDAMFSRQTIGNLKNRFHDAFLSRNITSLITGQFYLIKRKENP